MRLKSLLTAFAALACIGLSSPGAAVADGMPAAKSKAKRTGNHWSHYSRYSHMYHPDPYAYQYSPRGYYPYYASDYWRPAKEVRLRNRLHYNQWNTQPPRFAYYQSWGYPLPWKHKQWHDAYHGDHFPWHW